MLYSRDVVFKEEPHKVQKEETEIEKFLILKITIQKEKTVRLIQNLQNRYADQQERNAFQICMVSGFLLQIMMKLSLSQLDKRYRALIRSIGWQLCNKKLTLFTVMRSMI